jgi:hypothetical protein
LTYAAPSRVRGRAVSDWPCVSGRAGHSTPLLPCPR